MTIKNAILGIHGYAGTRSLDVDGMPVYCWTRLGVECNDACAAFHLNNNEVHCLALPILAAQCIARIADPTAPKKTLLDAHADAVEAAEQDEEEEASR